MNSHKRVSWAAIWAGAFVGMSLKLLLGMLGRWVSPDSVTLILWEFPLASISMKMGAWYLVSTVIGMYLGGSVTGWLAGKPHSGDSFVHGIVAWAVASVISFYWLAVAAGGIEASLPGPGSTPPSGLAAAGPGIAALGAAWAFWGLLLGALASGFGSLHSRPDEF